MAGTTSAPIEAAFLCGAKEVGAVFTDEQLLLNLDGASYRLEQAIAASGARYLGTTSDGQSVEFWNKGDEATLTIGDRSYPRCVTRDPALDGRYRALGLEPAWSWTLGPREAVLRLEPARLSLSAPRSAVQEGPDGWLMPTADGTLEITRSPGPCSDTMSDRIYPESVQLSLGEQAWAGCGTTPAGMLQVADWQLQDWDGKPLPEDVEITLAFDETGQAFGKSACNRYFGAYRLADEQTLALGPMAASRMACAEPLMRWETDYLAFLEGPLQFSIDERGRLILTDGQGEALNFQPQTASD
ncbi:MAG: META domain-containing protein [Halothiobacillaceae bacterium]